MKLLRITILAGLPLLLAVSCVPKKKLLEAESRVDRLQNDSTRFENSVAQLQNEKTALEADIKRLNSDKANLAADSKRSQDALNEQLRLQSMELGEKEKELQARAERLRDLQERVDRQNQLMEGIRKKVADALVNFKSDQLSVSVKDGKVYVSLSENLLFKSGSAYMGKQGREALGTLAEVLKENQDINVLIEGHTDSLKMGANAAFKDNWELSVERATAIVRLLATDYDVNPDRLIASGRADTSPIATNKTKEGRAKNRRTEIILSPKLDELYQILEESP